VFQVKQEVVERTALLLSFDVTQAALNEVSNTVLLLRVYLLLQEHIYRAVA
jgi:hypothetical protein